MTRPAPASGREWSAAHVRLVAAYGARFALRTGGGLVFLLLVLATGLVVAGIFLTPVEALLEHEAARDAMGTDDVGEAADRILRSDEVKSAVKGLTGASDREAEYYLREKPALLSAILIVLLFLFPYVACFGSFNQTTGDISSRGLRYLLLRTERTNVYFGRFLATATFGATTVVVLLAIVVLYIGLKLRVYSAGGLVLWGVEGALALVVLALPYMAFCAWISGAMDSPFASLVVCLLCAVLLPVLLTMVDKAAPADLGWLEMLTPWGWKYDLLSPDLGVRARAGALMAAFTAAFLWVGHRNFLRRDL